MKVFRLAKHAWRNDLSGKGAQMAGNRWNSKGVPMLYTAESRALAHAELTVHLNLQDLPADYWMLTLDIPDKLPVKELAEKELPADWKSWPHAAGTQAIGDAFIKEGKYLVMKVPSAVVDGDFNYLLNPQHRGMEKVLIADMKPFSFDARLRRSLDQG